MTAPLDDISQRRLDSIEMADYDLLLQLRNVPPARIRALPAGKLALVSDEGLAGVSIPIAVYLLQTAGARFLIDCGLGPRWRGTGVTEAPLDEGPRPGLRYRPVLDGPSLAAQLASSDFNPDRVVCTHLHLDHAGGARELGLAVETSEAELDAAFRPGAERDGYAQADLEALPLKVIELRADQPVGPFPASRELAPGVLAVDTSGHTPGSISLLACLGPWALICGDAVYPRLDETDSPAYVGMLRIRRLLQDWPGMSILPGHDTSALRVSAGGAWMGPTTVSA